MAKTKPTKKKVSKIKPNENPPPQCPPGYYYDTQLKKCIPNVG